MNTTERKSKRKSSQLPALGFLQHELDHFVGWTKDNGATYDVLNAPPVKYYDNMEEQRVTSGTERAAAGRLKEPIRTNHSGIPVITGGPISRKNIGYPPKIQLLFELKKTIEKETKGKKSR